MHLPGHLHFQSNLSPSLEERFAICGYCGLQYSILSTCHRHVFLNTVVDHIQDEHALVCMRSSSHRCRHGDADFLGLFSFQGGEFFLVTAPAKCKLQAGFSVFEIRDLRFETGL